MGGPIAAGPAPQGCAGKRRGQVFRPLLVPPWLRFSLGGLAATGTGGNSSQVLDQAVLGSRRPQSIWLSPGCEAGGAGSCVRQPLRASLGSTDADSAPAAMFWGFKGLVMGA